MTMNKIFFGEKNFMRKLFSLVALMSVALISFTSGTTEETEDAKDANFTITGDFSGAFGTDFDGATISVHFNGLSDEGESTQVELATAELVDGQFELEGFVDEATLANITLKLPDERYPTTGRAIIEPGSEMTLEFLGPHHALIATSEGLHAELVSSWEKDPEYLDASIAYSFYMESIYARMDKRQAAEEAEAAEEAAAETEIALGDETAVDEDQIEEEWEVSDEHETVAEEREPSEHAEVLDWASMECADYTVEFVSVLDRDYDTEYDLVTQSRMRMAEFMSEKRSAVLEKTFLESDDHTKRLFAMELGAFAGMDQQGNALSAWKQLASVLDEDTVTARIQPTIDWMERSVTIKENDEYLVPGVFAPTFTLPNFEGVDVTLASVLEENEVVMIDFWASWCGPCIAQFPHLKQLYAEYAEKGFEIVGISVDSSQEDWAGAVEEHQPPWINLGEINEDGWGPISQEYGVRFIPHTYVLDDESCIMKKDLQPEELEDFLEARLES